jgi:hypothetical protein
MFGHIYRKRYERPARRLRNIRVDEISSVDKGAARGAEIVLLKNDRREPMSLMEKVARMPERDLLAFAKSDAISKPELSQLIHDKAEALRKDGETREQAFVRYITSNPEGRDLYQIMKAASGPDHHQAAALQRHGDAGADDEDDDNGIDGKNPYHLALMHLADKHIERSGDLKMSRERAYAHIAQHSPVGQKLMVAAKEWDLSRAARAQARPA